MQKFYSKVKKKSGMDWAQHIKMDYAQNLRRLAILIKNGRKIYARLNSEKNLAIYFIKPYTILNSYTVL